MCRGGVNRVPLIDQEHWVVGILTRDDVVAAVARVHEAARVRTDDSLRPRMTRTERFLWKLADAVLVPYRTISTGMLPRWTTFVSEALPMSRRSQSERPGVPMTMSPALSRMGPGGVGDRGPVDLHPDASPGILQLVNDAIDRLRGFAFVSRTGGRWPR
jgi:hypothetical protein